MERDNLGICLSKEMLSNQLSSTFTHVTAYEGSSSSHLDEMIVMFSFPQMSGQEVLNTMKSTKKLVWRAGYFCPSEHHF